MLGACGACWGLCLVVRSYELVLWVCWCKVSVVPMPYDLDDRVIRGAHCTSYLMRYISSRFSKLRTSCTHVCKLGSSTSEGEFRSQVS